MTTFTATNARCHILTFKEGVLSAIAHDLKIEVKRFELNLDGEQLTGTFDLSSLEVVCAMKEGQEDSSALKSKDLRKIERSIQGDVLHSKKYPEARLTATATAIDGGYKIDGQLTLHGSTRPISVEATREGDRLTAEVSLHQPDFGIKPFSAMFGALKVQPNVTVVVSAEA